MKTVILSVEVEVHDDASTSVELDQENWKFNQSFPIDGGVTQYRETWLAQEATMILRVSKGCMKLGSLTIAVKAKE